MKPELIKKIYRYIPGKLLISEAIRSIYIPNNIHKVLRFWGWFSFQIENGKTISLFNYCSDIESQVYWYGIFGKWEKSELLQWAHLVKESKVILDVGANTGIYSLLAKKINPDSTVHAFEPMEKTYSKLLKNITKNNLLINIHKIALSNTSGEAEIYFPDAENITSVTVNKNLTGMNTGYVTEKIRTTTLDQFCVDNSINKIDLIKIDVESHEPEVLAGYSLLEQHLPAILCEVWNSELGSRIEKIVRNDIYDYYGLGDTDPTPVKVTSLSSEKFANYLLLPKGKKLFTDLSKV